MKDITNTQFFQVETGPQIQRDRVHKDLHRTYRRVEEVSLTPRNRRRLGRQGRA